MKKVTILVLLALLTLGLSLQSHMPLISAPEANANTSPTPAVLPTNQNKTQMLLFMNDIHKITNEVDFIVRSLEINFNKNEPLYKSLFKEVQVGVRAIRKSLTKNNLLVNTKETLCPRPDSFNQSEILRYTTVTVDRVTNASHIINSTSSLSGLKKYSDKMLMLTLKYVELVKDTMAMKFCGGLGDKVVRHEEKAAKVVFKNNLEVNNWYYGSTTQTKYTAYLVLRNQQFNLTNCPGSKPFVRDDEHICFDCEAGSIYNLGAMKCESCQPGKMLDIGSTTSNCVPCYGEIFIINHRFICKECATENREVYNPKTRKCYKCSRKQYFNDESRSCKTINCPPDSPRFNRELSHCEACPKGTIIKPNHPTECVKPDQVGNCTSSRPFYDPVQKVCGLCPRGMFFHPVSKSCGASYPKQTLPANATKETQVVNATTITNTTKGASNGVSKGQSGNNQSKPPSDISASETLTPRVMVNPANTLSTNSTPNVSDNLSANNASKDKGPVAKIGLSSIPTGEGPTKASQTQSSKDQVNRTSVSKIGQPKDHYDISEDGPDENTIKDQQAQTVKASVGRNNGVKTDKLPSKTTKATKMTQPSTSLNANQLSGISVAS